MATETNESKYRAPALAKGLDIIELLASVDRGLSQAEIGKMLGRTTSEIFRVLMVLRERGYVEVDDAELHHLSTRLFEVALQHPIIRRLTAIAGAEMQKLANSINQSIHLCILHSGKLLVVAQADSPDTNVITVRLGSEISIDDSASGRVLAAFMEQEELSDLLAIAGTGTSASRERFLADLPGVREAGYCQGRSLTIDGITNISAPVFDHTGKAVGAVTTPYMHRLSDTNAVPVDEARELLVKTTRELSRRMGAGVAMKDWSPSSQS